MEGKKKVKPIKMFEIGHEIIKESRKKQEKESKMTTKTEVNKIKASIRKAGALPYEFIELQIEGTFEEVLALKAMADDAFTATSSVQPIVDAKVVSKPIQVPQGDLVPEPTRVAFDGKCKYCKSDMWDNSTPDPKWPTAKPKWKCKSAECGYSYYLNKEDPTQPGNWWKAKT